jgi:hypothetical protein
MVARSNATRRSFIMWLSANDVSKPMIKRIAGHAGASVTAKHYTAPDLEAIQPRG